MRHGIAACFVLLLGGLCMGDAQAAAVCNNMPGDGDRIKCPVTGNPPTDNNDIDIDLDGVAISTTGPGTNNKGIWVEHAGGTAATATDPAVPADITIDVTGTATKNTITSTGSFAQGVYGKHTGIGNIDIDVTGVGISTSGSGSPGVHGAHTGTGNIDIEIEGTTTGRTISTTAVLGHVVAAQHSGTGNVNIDLEDIAISSTGGAPVDTTAQAKGVLVDHTGTGDVDIDVTGVSISTTGSDTAASEGISAKHSGDGDIDINIKGKTTGTTTTPSTITTTTLNSRGVWAQQFNKRDMSNMAVPTSGDIAITLGDTQINTSGQTGHGVYAQIQSKNKGTLTATLKPDVTITTSGSSAIGVFLANENDSTKAVDENGDPLSYDVTLVARGITVNTTGNSGYGLRAVREFGDGDVTINLDGSTITTEGDAAFGIHGNHIGDTSDGSVIINATNGSITTGGSVIENGVTTLKGFFAFGIYADHQYQSTAANSAGTGDIRVTTRNFKIKTTSTAPRSSTNPNTFAYGIYARHRTSGDIVVDMQQGSSVTTEGRSSHGVVAYNYGDAATRSTTITIGGPITVNGVAAQGVRVGVVSSGAPQRVAALDDEGYRLHKVTLNSNIESQGPGIYLSNGGRVVIGPQGSISSGTGIAILATGTVPEVPEDNTDPLNVIPAVPAIPPKLRVDLNLSGRRVSQAIGDDWILNDGGETTIAMNGVVLHDGATGATEDTARNGAYNVRMASGSVKVTDRTNADPTMWVVSDRAEDVIADRDFSAADFSERRRAPPSPPPPPPEPDPPAVDGATFENLLEGVVANALNSIISAPLGEQEAPASPSSSPFIEEYAPRAAVYEALPAALLGLNDTGQGTGAPVQQGTFTFARTLEDHGSLSPANSTVGQRHALGYGGAQFGRQLQLGETLGASVALHRVWSTVDVEAGTGGGEIGVEATGLVLDGAWNGPDGFYGKAGLSMTHYRLGTWSEDRDVGMLAGGVGARGSLARIEAGREVSLGGGLHVAPRIWFKRSALSVDGFTDTVGSRVSIPGTSRVSGGIGMAARAERRAGSGMLSLRGSVDLAHVLDGSAAFTEVSGARLTSEAEDTELRLALSGVYRQGRFSLAAEASLNGSDPGDARGAVGLRLFASF